LEVGYKLSNIKGLTDTLLSKWHYRPRILFVR
jgi:hypothetical protein